MQPQVKDNIFTLIYAPIRNGTLFDNGAGTQIYINSWIKVKIFYMKRVLPNHITGFYLNHKLNTGTLKKANV